MEVKILRDTVAGGEAVSAGDVIDVTEADAAILFGLGRAKAHEAKAIKPTKGKETSKR